jgi:hypothetical protein
MMLRSYEQKIKDKCRELAKGSGYVRLQPKIVLEILDDLDKERERSRKLQACILRNSHDDCYCPACVDARKTIEEVGLRVRL